MKPKKDKSPSVYSYFESQKMHSPYTPTTRKVPKNYGKPPVKADKNNIPLIPSLWSELLIGNLRPAADKGTTRYLDLRNKSDLSSFKKGATKKLDDFSTKKLRWLLNRRRSKRAVNEKFVGDGLEMHGNGEYARKRRRRTKTDNPFNAKPNTKNNKLMMAVSNEAYAKKVKTTSALR